MMVEEEGIDPAISELFNQNQDLQSRNSQLSNALSGASFDSQEEQNLIQYQLETEKILERIEHFLKGDVIKFGEGGSYYDYPTKRVLTRVFEDKKSKIKYYIEQLKEKKKGTEIEKEVLVKIINKEEQEIDILEYDSKRILEKLDKRKMTDLGFNYIYILDEDKKPLNEYGVAELMRIISMYVTKETFLSYYTEERINEIMADLADALNNFLYCNYEKLGMDTKFKESKYTLICLNMIHTIESCYRRALGGAEQENIRTRAIVTQNQSASPPSSNMSNSLKPKWKLFKPSTW